MYSVARGCPRDPAHWVREEAEDGDVDTRCTLPRLGVANPRTEGWGSTVRRRIYGRITAQQMAS
jgi:hypothetical protein